MDITVPGRPDATRQLEIRTPVAATSVRGTRFNVQVTDKAAAAPWTKAMSPCRGRPDTCPAPSSPPGFGAAMNAGSGQPPVQRLPAIATDRLPSTG